jgi:hypothetical protein
VVEIPLFCPRTRSRLAGLALVALALVAVAWASGCGGSGVPRPTTALAAPDSASARRATIDALGRRAWDAMAAGAPQRLLLDDLDLRTVLDSAGATRLSARRLSVVQRIGETDELSRLLAGASYAGVCLQGARDEAEGGVTGLRSPGWVFDRILVIGRRGTGRRIAAWLEGLFLYTDAGFFAVDLERVERPRWEHSDLEIAPCDLSIRDDLPEGAR